MNNPLFMKSTVHTSSNKLAYCGAFSRRDMTNEEKLRLVQSVYSNPKRLRIAQLVLSEKKCTGEKISELTGYSRSTISEALKEMEAVGVVINVKSSYFRYYSLTSLGKRLLALTSL